VFSVPNIRKEFGYTPNLFERISAGAPAALENVAHRNAILKKTVSAPVQSVTTR
jgi:hypothetical protein